MDGWMDGTGTRKTLFHWKVCMKPISGGKALYNFYFFKKGRDGEPIHKKYKTFKSTRRRCH